VGTVLPLPLAVALLAALVVKLGATLGKKEASAEAA
jgi:hypothetical protein